ncbi:MAG: S-layer homology domain-containing protein [Clostridia bacterium]|nr:S-layer homology domain-containing protein [Clostridia bacterium]
MKKAIVYITVIAVIMSLLPIAGLAQDYTDVPADYPYYKDIQMLTSFGVFQGDEGMFYPDSTISRCDFALILSRVLGISDINAPENYSDVPSTHYASKAINTLSHIGIINGVGSGLFMPDADITYEQVVKLLVSITGYDQKALAGGGYPYGYMSVASSLGITKGVFDDGTLTRAEVALMLNNALVVDLFQKTSFTQGHEEYKVIKGDNLLKCNLKILIAEDVFISSNEHTSLGKNQADENKIIAGGVTYVVGNSNADQYVGRTVTLYYRVEGSKNKVLYVDESDSASVEVDAENIISFSNNVLTYNDGGKTKTLKLSSDAEVIYNGKSCVYSEDLFSIENGSIRFVRENNKYNLALIEEYQNIFIGYVDTTDRIIFDKYTVKTTIDDKEAIVKPGIEYGDENEISSVFEMVGLEETFDFDDLNEGMLVSVYQSKDKQFTKTIINQTIVNGQISEIGTDYYVINGSVYKYDKAVSRMPELKIGDEATFYIDVKGKIGAWEINTDGEKYGMLIAGKVNSDTLDASVKLKVLEQDGKVTLFNLNNKILLNDKPYHINVKNEKDAFIEALKYDPKTDSYSDTILRQLIKYKKNSQNEIVAINTHQYKSKDDEAFSLDFDQSVLQYRTGIRSFEMKFYVSPETVIFRSPFAVEADDDGKLYRVLGLGSLRGNGSYTVQAYDLSDTGCAGAIILYSGSATGTPDEKASWLVVEGVTDALGEDGETTKKVYGMSNGKYVKYLATSSEAVSLSVATGNTDRFPKCGDVIRVSLDDNNQITGVGLEFDIDNLYEKFSGNDAKPFIYSNWLRYATVYSREGNYLYVAKGVTKNVSDEFFASADMFVMAVSGNVYIYDSEEQKIKKGSANDIYTYKTNGEKASKIFARFNYDTTTDILIIR